MITAITVSDLHTGGEPVRIVEAGWPRVEGASILDKRAFAEQNHDHLRKAIMWEPRGHFDMYGVLPVEPSMPGAAMAVLFMHNSGWSTMCGHATIALGRYAIEAGIVPAVEPVTRFGLEAPCGLVEVSVAVHDGRPGLVSFESVPGFAAALDQVIDVVWRGAPLSVRYDLGYGGAYYAVVHASRFGLAFGRDPARDFVEAAAPVTDHLRTSLMISHPDDPRLGFLYGTILTDGRDQWSAEPTRNVCVFADRQVDRSPTGSGVTARLALMHARGQIATGQRRRFESIIGSGFDGEVVRADRNRIIARVSGQAYSTGQSTFTFDADDPLNGGFLVR
jgi:trans-L-3-hydroxyproline dehydratase